MQRDDTFMDAFQNQKYISKWIQNMDFACTEKILTRNNDRGFEKSAKKSVAKKGEKREEEILLDLQFREEGNISGSQEPLWEQLIQGLFSKLRLLYTKASLLKINLTKIFGHKFYNNFIFILIIIL